MKTYKVIEDGIEYDVCEDENELVSKTWYLNNQLHRESGPAYETNKWKNWYKHGVIHRDDGPAIMYQNEQKEYWLNGVYYSNSFSDEEWILFQIIT